MGRKYATYLSDQNIGTALKLKRASLKWIRQKMSVIGERIKGQITYPLEDQRASKKMILVSRSFKTPLSSVEDLASFISAFTEKAAEKLRNERKLATQVYVFIKTDRFYQESYYANEHLVGLDIATDDTLMLLQAAHIGLKKIFCSGQSYKRAGICLCGLVAHSCLQYSLFNQPSVKREELTNAIDQINKEFGSRTVTYGVSRLKVFALTQRDHLSPCYTTNWG